jgi:hypothetical protein
MKKYKLLSQLASISFYFSELYFVALNNGLASNIVRKTYYNEYMQIADLCKNININP